MNSFDRFLAQLKKIALTEKERTANRRQLLEFMQMKPLKKELTAREKTMMPSRTPQKSIMMQFFLKPMPIALIAVLLLGSVAAGAQNTLPGNVLYPIKIAGESIHATLTFDAQTQADLETKLAIKRLEEAEKLATRGALNAEARAKIEANFEKHAERVRTRIDKFEAKEKFSIATDVAAKFQNSIEAHSRVLENMNLEHAAAAPANIKNEATDEAASIARKARLKADEIRIRIEDMKKREVMKKNDQAKRDGSNEVETEIKIDDKKKINIVPPTIIKIENTISWPEAIFLIRSCKVATLSQQHNKEVRLTLKDGTTRETQEPTIDAVIAEAAAASATCGTFPIATE